MERDISFNGRQSQVITLTRGPGAVNDDIVKGYIYIHMQQHESRREEERSKTKSGAQESVKFHISWREKNISSFFLNREREKLAECAYMIPLPNTEFLISFEVFSFSLFLSARWIKYFSCGCSTGAPPIHGGNLVVSLSLSHMYISVSISRWGLATTTTTR
jgi:hypothetical protein